MKAQQDNPATIAQLTLVGNDASDFLQGYVTSDILNLHHANAKPTAFTDLKGRVVSNGWMYGTSDHVRFLVHESTVGIVERHLEKYLMFAKSKFSIEDVRYEISNDSEGRISLEPFNWHITTDLEQRSGDVDVATRGGYALVSDITTGMFLPQMLGLHEHDAVSFTKGCYLGQEIVARAEHRGAVKRRLVKCQWRGQTLEVGEEVKSSGNQKGVVISNDKLFALVVLSGEASRLVGNNSELDVLGSIES